jgi:CRP/FNR family nitrogen fixation transcriptional regulator
MLESAIPRDGLNLKVSARHTVPALHTLFNSVELAAAVMPFGRNAEIYGEDEPADNVYEVVRGAVRTYCVLCDGRRQVQAFYFPGDVFGLEFGPRHSCSAEAIDRSQVAIVKRSLLLGAAERDLTVAQQLWRATAIELARAQGHSLLLIKSAHERVAAFLLDMAERLDADGVIDLPMSRQDIADNLGLTIETVSRTLSSLEDVAAISLPAARHIVLRNRSALRRINA